MEACKVLLYLEWAPAAPAVDLTGFLPVEVVELTFATEHEEITQSIK